MIHKAVLRIFKIYQENIDDGVQLCKPTNLTKLELRCGWVPGNFLNVFRTDFSQNNFTSCSCQDKICQNLQNIFKMSVPATEFTSKVD